MRMDTQASSPIYSHWLLPRLFRKSMVHHASFTSR